MAASQNDRHKSRLIREMARDLNRHDHSVASSTGSHHGTVSDSTVSDFDPENEAIMSTRQMDYENSQKLPELRDTAKKYGRWNGGRQPDFVVNTSAIGRAFPDFSQGGSSDDSMSIEVGRGAKIRQRTPSQVPRHEYSNDIDSPIVTIGDFRILNTPPMKQQAKGSHQQESQRHSSRKVSRSQRASSASLKENIPPSNTASPVYLPDYVSGATRSATGEQQRSLADIHARVADDSDGSFIGDERPPTVTFAVKNSRFNSFQPRNSPLSNINNQKTRPITDAMVDALAGRRKSSHMQTPSRPSTSTVNSNTQNPTNQSFLLPNMPEISELVSGTFKDGTPVFTKSGKVQSRFSSHGSGGARDAHNPVDSIPIPGDEKAIFLSLQLLQDKVAELEMERANTQTVIEELQKNNYQLQAEKKEIQNRRRSDSALGMADSGSDGEYARDNKNLIAEKTKLEAQLKSMQSRMDGAERKITNQDLRLKTNSAERDQAVKQLAEAYSLSEQLKSENQSLREENESLRQQLSQFLSESRESAHRWQEMEAALQKKIVRREQAVSRLRDVTREVTEVQYETRTKNKATVSRSSKSRRHSEQIQVEVQARKLSKGSDAPLNTRGRPSSGQVPSVSQSQPQQRLRSRSQSQSRRTSRQSAAQVEDEEEASISETSDDSPFDDTTKTIHKDLDIQLTTNANADEDTDFSSILGDDLVRLRQILAIEKATLEARIAKAPAARLEDDTVRSTRSLQSNTTLQRKSSSQGLTGILKNRPVQDEEDITGRLSVKSDRGAEKSQITRSDTLHRRRNSENSIPSRISTRRQSTADEMTSAFILPDITIHGTTHRFEKPVLSESARRKLDQLCQHDVNNCTVCSRVVSFATKDGMATKIETKKSVHIEKPIPVSERMPIVNEYEDEPTTRPSVAPGLALATVIKGLEDEIAHLKLELSPLQVMYNKHDPSLGMRIRKSLSAQISKIQKEIDRKSDQLYALYDVLEGQKLSGQEMSEKEIEVTLQSIGVDVEALNHNMTETENKQNEGDSDDDSDLEDLPWEGIEDTTNTGSGKGRRQM